MVFSLLVVSLLKTFFRNFFTKFLCGNAEMEINLVFK